MSTREHKLQAARAALAHLPERGIVGLGSGSTAALFIEELGSVVREGRKLEGVPTSEESRRLAMTHGIPLLDDVGPWSIDVCVDGADEVSAALDLIKGGGGCHAREKIINHAAAFNIIVVDDSKISEQLGEKWAVPVEVLTFGHQTTRARLAEFGTTELRLRDGTPWVTDSGNLIYDVRVGRMAEPATFDTRLLSIPGVVETGLFVKRADLVLVAGESGLQCLRRS